MASRSVGGIGLLMGSFVGVVGDGQSGGQLAEHRGTDSQFGTTSAGQGAKPGAGNDRFANMESCVTSPATPGIGTQPDRDNTEQTPAITKLEHHSLEVFRC